MPTESLEPVEFEEIEVELSRDLLCDIDEYAITHGYRSPSAVVQAALES